MISIWRISILTLWISMVLMSFIFRIQHSYLIAYLLSKRTAGLHLEVL